MLLQDQYQRDFESLGMRTICSVSNYTCFGERAEGRANKITCSSEKIERCKDCPYNRDKALFNLSPYKITNYSFFLNGNSSFKPHKIAILDEAHNIPEELSRYVEFSIGQKYCEKYKIPFLKKSTDKEAISWIVEAFIPSAKKNLVKIITDIKSLEGKFHTDIMLETKYDSLLKEKDSIKRSISNAESLVGAYISEEWVYSYIEATDTAGAKIEFKPIDVGSYAKSIIFDKFEFVLLMSATVISKENFCKMLGLDPKEVGYIKLASPFPIENRPVNYFPVGGMNAKNIDETLPTLAKAVEAILDFHKGEKGIIHAHNYRIAQYLYDNIDTDRLLIHDSKTRNIVLEEHTETDKPTVLLSPSMQEGVDLKGDLSKFQVICKIPYPYLGDKLIKKKMERWKWWYDYETLKTIVQSVGRSIRTEEDVAITYILDSDWKRFSARVWKDLPENMKVK
jgi:Rad3-related DNA helicase